MIKTFTILFLLLTATGSFSQRALRVPVWIPADSTSIVGLAIELNALGNARNCHIYGINVELLGFGVLLPFSPGPIVEDDKNKVNSQISEDRS